ncbi:hypothetical protein KIW84_023582 [Lathyrus oleraceus]|uniref:DUF7745 domain-containing protein n=1 Tax=Pisum sativum TaxID=3888 RepID=A0A9D4YEJ1_PEA|nr:hypothetical protein KIW84_023582 [Pisum sativum]
MRRDTVLYSDFFHFYTPGLLHMCSSLTHPLVICLVKSGLRLWCPWQERMLLGKPEDKLEKMVLHGMGAGNPALLHKIFWAWEKIHIEGTELGKKNYIAKEPYRQWVLERVKFVKLPFSI